MGSRQQCRQPVESFFLPVCQGIFYFHFNQQFADFFTE